MSERRDVAVVGGGVIGCAAALACAARGLRTTLFEQFEIGHVMGSSHGASRIIRLAYHDPVYIDLARDAYKRWTELAAANGVRLLVKTGGVDLGAAGDPALSDRAEAMRARRVPFEWLDADALRDAYPQFKPAPGTAALYQSETGILAADRCLRVIRHAARRHGAVLRERERVLSIEPIGSGVELTTSNGRVRAERVVVAVGGWAPALLAGLGLLLPLRVTREQVTVLAPERREDFAPGRFPVFIHHRGVEPLVSGFPCFGVHGVKLMFDLDGPEIDADADDRGIDPARVADMADYAQTALRGLSRRAIETVACLYTYTPDGDFIVDVHPEHEQIVILSPCSGHGFKFAPVLGDAAAMLATSGQSGLAHDRFSIERPALRSSTHVNGDCSVKASSFDVG